MFGPYEREVMYYETDRMGIVHHSNYARWFEEARHKYLEAAGIPYAQVESLGILIPVLSVECTYRKAFKYGDVFQVYLQPVKFNGIKAEFTYEVRNKADGELYTTGKSSHCFVDEKLQLLNIKKSHPQVYELFLDPVRDTLGN